MKKLKKSSSEKTSRKNKNDDMVYRFISNEFCLVTDFDAPRVLQTSHVTISLSVAELATDAALLAVLGFENLYAESFRRCRTPSIGGGRQPTNREDCVKFMTSYLSAFRRDLPALENDARVTIMATAQRIRDEIIELCQSRRLETEAAGL